MGERRLFTSESVTEGHPDKVCDQIADAILDAVITDHPCARVACEVCATTGLVMVMGEISCDVYVDIPHLTRDVIRDIGYTRAKYGFDADTCAVLTTISEQSPDICNGVNRPLEFRSSMGLDEPECVAENPSEIGAGDQGMVFGYATNESDTLMPMPIELAHALARRLAEVRKNETLAYLRPDGKTQVTLEYDGDAPVRVDTIVVSAQHSEAVRQERIRADIIQHVVKPVIPAELLDDNTKIYVNPSGRFVEGGPKADAGVTGRKIIVDTYGGMARNGGGALSGKDPTKVDRSANYAARHVAKNLVAAGVADRCEVQIAYAIGMARPVSVTVDTFGTGKISENRITEIVNEVFDLTPAGIIRRFDLRRPIYRKLANYGHYGTNALGMPWEALDKVDEVKRLAAK